MQYDGEEARSQTRSTHPMDAFTECIEGARARALADPRAAGWRPGFADSAAHGSARRGNAPCGAGRARAAPGPHPSSAAVGRRRLGGLNFGRRLPELLQLAAEIGGDGAHAVDARFGFGGAVVVRVGIDVVGVDLARAVGDEFDAGDPDAVVGDETPVALDDRM